MNGKKGVKWAFAYLGYILFPSYCVICGEYLSFDQKEDRICESCEKNIPYIVEDACEICGKPTVGGGICEVCQAHRPVFTKGIGAFSYDDVRNGIARMKYKGGKVDGKKFGELMTNYLLTYHGDWVEEIDVVIPVPLHPKKKRNRGFNQSEILCEWICKICDLPYDESILWRTKNTKAQSKLGKEKRLVNIKGVFSGKDCTGKVVLLVDDIYTTGATANECSRVLYRNGAKEVRVFCLSHTKGI